MCMHVRVCMGFEQSLRSRFCAVYIFVVVITICLSELRSCVEVEVAVLGSPVPNNPYGLREHKAALSLEPADMNESPRHRQGKESFGNRRSMQWNIETYSGIKLRSIGLPFILSGGTLISASTVRHCENVFQKLQGKDEYNQKKKRLRIRMRIRRNKTK